MTNLYHRVLLWHKLLCLCTGGLALCSAKHRLNREEAQGWVAQLRNVADDIDQFLNDGTFALDDRGARIVKSGIGNESPEVRHVEPDTRIPSGKHGAVSRKAGGLRVATRRKQ